MEVELAQNVVNVWIMVCDFNCDAYSIIIKRVNREGVGVDQSNVVAFEGLQVGG